MTTPKPPPGFVMMERDNVPLDPPTPPPGFQLIDPQSAPAAVQQPQQPAYEGWLDYGKDLNRTAFQGLTLGLGDEITAGVRSALSSDLDYDTALEEERGAIDRFRTLNPGTAFAAELAGGFAVPGLGMARGIAAAPSLGGKMLRGAGYGGGFGMVAGYGSGEGSVENRLESAGDGLAFGAGLGAVLPVAGHYVGKGLRKGEELVAQARDHEKAAKLYLGDRLRRNGVTEASIADDLARGQEATRFANGRTVDLPETIADVTPTTQRVLRGIKVGGDADDVIEPFLGRRQSGEIDFRKGVETGGQYTRLSDDMQAALKQSDTNVADQVEKITAKRKKDGNALFKKARDMSEPFDLNNTQAAYALEAQNMANPKQRAILLDAVRLFDQKGSTPDFSKMGSRSAQNATNFGVTNIERFHNAKEALDDLIASAEVREQGNLKRLLTRLKHDLMDEIFQPDAKGNATRNAAYAEALDTYASQSALLNAADLGKAFANGTEEITPRIWRQLSEPEKNMVRRAWTQAQENKMGGKAAGPTTDYTGALRQPNTAKDLQLLLPPSAGKSANFPGGNRERLTELVRRESRISDTSRKVLGNSTTAEKTVDAIDVGRMGRALRYIKDSGGVTMAAIGAMQEGLERMAAVRGPRARYLAEKLLTTNPEEQQAFLAEVVQTYGQAQANKIISAMDRTLSEMTKAGAVSGGAKPPERRPLTGSMNPAKAQGLGMAAPR